jgi:hypothetical protein
MKLLQTLVVLGAGPILACSGSSGDGGASTSSSSAISACTVPAAATQTDGDSGGCSAQTILQLCEVPTGSVVEQNGSIVTPDGGVVACTDQCSATEYSLNCGASASAASSLNCRAILSPGPLNQYCCPCGN